MPMQYQVQARQKCLIISITGPVGLREQAVGDCKLRELQVNNPPELSSPIDAPVGTASQIGQLIFGKFLITSGASWASSRETVNPPRTVYRRLIKKIITLAWGWKDIATSPQTCLAGTSINFTVGNDRSPPSVGASVGYVMSKEIAICDPDRARGLQRVTGDRQKSHSTPDISITVGLSENWDNRY